MTNETAEPIDPPDGHGGGNATAAESESPDTTIAVDPPDNQGGGTGG